MLLDSFTIHHDLVRHPGARYALAVPPAFEPGSGAHSRRTLTRQAQPAYLRGGRSTRSLARYARPFAFQTTPAPWPVHPPTLNNAESGEIESHGLRRALVSGEARRPGRFTSHACAGGFKPHVRRHTGLSRARLTAYATSA
jgi:hypothetical protein